MKCLMTDELWAVVEPLLPKRRPHRKGGRPWVDDRAVVTGILFVLRSGIPWRMLPQEMGCGSGVTTWRRLRRPHPSPADIPPHAPAPRSRRPESRTKGSRRGSLVLLDRERCAELLER